MDELAMLRLTEGTSFTGLLLQVWAMPTDLTAAAILLMLFLKCQTACLDVPMSILVKHDIHSSLHWLQHIHIDMFFYF